MSSGSILILHSSQTGTAKSIADLFVSDDLPSITTAKYPNLVKNPRIYDFTAYMKIDPDLSLLGKETLPVVFIIATTGQGDFPDNALPLMRIIRRLDKKFPPDSPKDSLPFHTVKMLNLGLGDSNYDRFNGGIQQVERFLTKLGCQKLLPTVHADDGIGLELGVEKWRKQTIEFLTNYVPIDEQASTLVSERNQANVDITPSTASSASNNTQTPTNDIPLKEEGRPTTPQNGISFFPIPKTYVSPPMETQKPEFLMKKHVTKIETLLTTHSFSQENTFHQFHQDSILDFSSDCIPYHAITPISSSFATPLYNATLPGGGVLIGSELLLQQYITGNNLHSFLLHQFNPDSQHAIAQQGLLAKLGEMEYGYSNINTNPIFAEVQQISLPSQTSIDCPLVKTAIDLTFSLPHKTAAVIARIPTSPVSNPTTSIDIIHGESQESRFTSLYHPGDSISIICPNNYDDVKTVLEHTATLEFSRHGLLLTSSPSNVVDPPSPVVVSQQSIQTPLTHLHCNQPHQDFINLLLGTQIDNPFQGLLNLRGVFYDPISGTPVSNIPSLQSILTHCIDLGSPIKKALLRCFADTCTPLDPQLHSDLTQYQRCVVELLYHLMSKGGIGKQTKVQIEGQSITLTDLLQLFSFESAHNELGIDKPLHMIRPDINSIIELCSSLKPRSYSISSSPYKSLLFCDKDPKIFNLDSTDDLSALSSIISKIPGSDKPTIVAGTQFRFVATLTSDELPPLTPLDKAIYSGSASLPSSIPSLCNQHYIDKVNNVNTGGKRSFEGKCTHMFLQIYHDLCDLKAVNPQTKADFFTFLSTPSQNHSNPRFWGCVVKKESDDFTNCADVTIHLPLFFHSSPSFRPPSLLTSRDTTSVVNNNSRPVGSNMLLFGPGTGASPFLSFIEHKFYLALLSWTLSNPRVSPARLVKRYNSPSCDSNGPSHCSINLHDDKAITSTYHNALKVFANTPSSLGLTSTNDSHDSSFGDVTLFTGNRYRTQDYLHHQHWFDFLTASIPTAPTALNSLYSVFSREAEDSRGTNPHPRHVQDLIAINGEMITKHILEGGFIYVCGDGVSMAKQVQKAIETALETFGAQYFSLFSPTHDVLPQTNLAHSDSNSNQTNYQCRFTDETVSSALIDYISKNPGSFSTQFERESWAKGIVAVMMKGGRYNTDVW